jgi:hypothetical protein
VSPNGSRHQRFILELGSGQTLLVAHNIDLAPRLPALAVGETVDFNGVYEWTPEGGVIHWTAIRAASIKPVGSITRGWRTNEAAAEASSGGWQ